MALKLPRGLYALVDDGLRPEVPVPEKARWAIAGGARTLQLRLEQTADRQALEWVRQTLEAARPAGVVVLVNDRVDLCLAAGADGVHLGDDDLPVTVARRLLGAAALVGRTARGLDDVARARAEGADHVGLGPVFGTTTKRVAAPVLGLQAFERHCRGSSLPVVGIAGITLSSIGAVARAGAHAAAVAADWLLADDPVSRVRALEQAFWAA
ncbi:MAG: thiamine phosphate synthase [Myxococcaceae bacterium]|nr:thiamine phosphate synthase [Myxococcaceae bacterium]MCA3013945.1 thiamine phosphate synthase [Myxococcaceae bacterium]